MKKLALAAAMAMLTPLLAVPAFAAEAMSTAATSLGDLLDNPQSKAILEKHVPQLVANPQISMARAMTLKQIQNYAGDTLPDAKLAEIDADLAKLTPAK